MLEKEIQYMGNCIREARKTQMLTQDELSEKLGISVRHIANIEKGKINPSFEILYTLIRGLNLSADILFYPEYTEIELEIKQLIQDFQSCDRDDRQIVFRTLQCMVNEMQSRRANKANENKSSVD